MPDLRKNVKWTLVDQALRSNSRHDPNSKCFTKILFMDKYTLLLAKLYGVFQFRMRLTWDDKACFWFADRENDDVRSTTFELPYDRAEKLFKLLDPEVFNVFVERYAGKSQFFNLISLASGKLGFGTWEREVIPDILKIHWKRIGELDCYAKFYKLVDEWAAELKEFDKLNVGGIETDAQLAMVLKQKAKVLRLKLFGFNGSNLPLSSAVINDIIKKCCLEFNCYHMNSIVNSIVPTVNLIANACKSLERLELRVDRFYLTRVNNFNHLLDRVAEYYGKYAELVSLIKGFEFASSLDFCAPDLAVTFSLPSDWKDQLKSRLDVKEVAVEMIRESRYEDTQIHLVDKDVRADFKFRAKFRHSV